MTQPAAAVMGIEGLTISAEERAVYQQRQPAGFILFRRNVDNPAQLRALTDDLRDLTGNDDLPILVDQEGGRVQRLNPPHWPAFPPPALFGFIAENNEEAALDLARNLHQAMGMMLREAGFTVNCAPDLDLPQTEADPVIGDRAFSAIPDMAIRLARAAKEGLEAGGMQAVIKHIPGHGRATVDSHKSLPVIDAPRDVLEGHDFKPFRALNDAHWAIPGHLVFTDIDPDLPATWSPKILNDLVRTDFGFDGILVTDCLYMDALGGPIPERARKAVEAGNDLALSCHGDPAEKAAVLDAVPDLSATSQARLARAVLPASNGDWRGLAREHLEKASQLAMGFEARSNSMDWRLTA